MDYDVTIAVLQLAGIVINGILAAIAIYTLREIRRQRQNMYLPDLAFCDTSCEFGLDEYDLFHMARQGTYKHKTGAHVAPSIRMQNVGFGVAKQVVLTWTYDYDAFLRELDACDPKKLIRVTRGKDAVRFVYLKDPEGIGTEAKVVPQSFFHYVMPAAGTNEMTDVALPWDYIALIEAWAHATLIGQRLLCREDPYETLLKWPPPLRGRVTYSDIAGTQHSTPILVTVNLSNPYDEQEHVLVRGMLRVAHL